MLRKSKLMVMMMMVMMMMIFLYLIYDGDDDDNDDDDGDDDGGADMIAHLAVRISFSQRMAVSTNRFPATPTGRKKWRKNNKLNVA